MQRPIAKKNYNDLPQRARFCQSVCDENSQKLGKKNGETSGRTQGIELSIITTVRNLFKMGLSTSDIAKAHGLSNEQIINAVKNTEDSK